MYRDDAEVNIAKAGENLRLRVSGIEEEDISSGFVACGRKNAVPAVTQFEAQLQVGGCKPIESVWKITVNFQVLELLEHKAIFTAGYKAVLHVHSSVEECEITKLVAQIDLKTKEKKKVGNDGILIDVCGVVIHHCPQVKFVKGNSLVTARIAVEKPICVETFDKVPQLGRFTLRDEGRTIAIGRIEKLPKRDTA